MKPEEKYRILFISHSYPPIMGGVESQNYNLAEGLSKIAEVKIIANSKGKYWLPVFLPRTFIKAVFLMRKYDFCLVGNGVLAPIAFALKLIYPSKKFFAVVHGLDITFAFKGGFLSKVYSLVNMPSLKRLDRLFMVGNYTINLAVQNGIPGKKCIFIPNGVSAEDLRKTHSRKELSDLLGIDTENKKVVLRLARFVPHKGLLWFIKNVVPKLTEQVVLVAVGHRVAKKTPGDPDSFIDCQEYITEKSLQHKVKLMSSISHKDLEILLNTVDLVVSPNIHYPGSVEGFGINVLEAAICERVVFASNLQGLADAIHDNKNGFLLEPENVDMWINKINYFFNNEDPNFISSFGSRAARYTEDNFSWDSIVKKYLQEMTSD